MKKRLYERKGYSWYNTRFRCFLVLVTQSMCSATDKPYNREPSVDDGLRQKRQWHMNTYVVLIIIFKTLMPDTQYFAVDSKQKYPRDEG